MPGEDERDQFTAYVGTEPKIWLEGEMVAWAPVGGGPEKKRVMPLGLLAHWVAAAQRVLDEAKQRGSVVPFPRQPLAPAGSRFGEAQAAFDAGWHSPRRDLPPREGLKLRLDKAPPVTVGDDRQFHIRVAGPDGVVEIVYSPHAGFEYVRQWQRALAEWQARNGPEPRGESG